MNDVVTSMPAMLLLTLASYLLGVFIHRKSGISVLHPFITSLVVIIGTLLIFKIPYEEYRAGNRILDFLLGPSVVALALRLYDNLEIVRKNLAAILSAVVVGSTIGIVGVWAIGSTALIAISVVFTGVLGAVLGPGLINLLKITDPVARGAAMGCSAHGIGTGRAIELGAVEGAVSGLCIVLMGVATSILVPLLNLLLGL